MLFFLPGYFITTRNSLHNHEYLLEIFCVYMPTFSVSKETSKCS